MVTFGREVATFGREVASGGVLGMGCGLTKDRLTCHERMKGKEGRQWTGRQGAEKVATHANTRFQARGFSVPRPLSV